MLLGLMEAISIISAGFSIQVIMEHVSGNPAVKPARHYFALWLFFHALWIVVFAGLHYPVLAFAFCVVQWGVAMLCIQKFFNVEARAGRKVILFFLMTTYWMLLNGGILSLNNHL